ncbi:MAG: hypothetical protein FRX49_09697 [Trebouxia sp. A1-2]|nr:MAG: hypothetical protein FRX49_09697 [Trebouxia sp. A1-2]
MALEDCTWMVSVGAALFFLNSCLLASAMAGTALVYPGWTYMNWGVHITANPMVVSGMGAVYIPWATVPVMTVVIVTFIFLVMRTFLMRGDDPFHVVLWCAPGIACATAIINASYVLFTLSSYSGWKFNDLSPQGAVITDDETLRCLKSEDAPTGLKGWLRMLYNRLYVHDIDAVIGRRTMQTAANGFATMLQIYKAEYVSQESPINIRLRGIAALGMALGILLGGWRLVPVSGVQLAKMSPFRSYVVTTASTLSSIVAVGLHLGDGVNSYINISAVVAIGLAEGLSHVNLRVYPPSASSPTELSQTESAIASATQALATMRNVTCTGQGTLESVVIQAVVTYQQARDRC